SATATDPTCGVACSDGVEPALPSAWTIIADHPFLVPSNPHVERPAFPRPRRLRLPFRSECAGQPGAGAGRRPQRERVMIAIAPVMPLRCCDVVVEERRTVLRVGTVVALQRLLRIVPRRQQKLPDIQMTPAQSVCQFG